MFVRWQKRERGDVRWDAVLVHSFRLDGRVRQQVIGTIAGFRQSDPDDHRRLDGYFVACLFWHRARARLKAFGLTEAKHAAAVATLAAKVPEMPEEYIATAFEMLGVS